ncbi:proton-coupled folate transporter-like [Orussus abietinus]|uniref:proton-coupled folate transporter-like n=1 Tax=Orussus abietinus TaxID=222816 RepID=UPI00062594FF|nr:proton-coupled folate transporter-like [Orussus abietinus]XP_012270847.1 proton-coupled folate transporter-like [Orussus abietinus]
MDRISGGWKKYALVQPPMMMLLFAQAMTGTILTDLIVYRTCRVTLAINKTECLVLHQNSSSEMAFSIEAEAQPRVSIILMVKSLIESMLPAFLSLFLGPWSDKYGRKPLLVSGYAGFTIMFIIFSFLCNWDIDPWFLLLAYVPPAFCGGFCALILATYCYISDITTDVDRAWQLAWLEASISIGLLLGIFLGPLVYDKFGYSVVFIVATACCITATLYVLFYVPEPVRNQSTASWGSLFNISLVQEMVRSCIKRRNGFDRTIVWCCIIALALSILVLEGESTIGFLFARERLGWDIMQFSNYLGTNVIMGIFGTILGVKLLGDYVGVSNTALSVLAYLSNFISACIKSFTWLPWHMYLSVGLGMFGGVHRPLLRAIISKSAPTQDIGKVFSLTTSVETITPLGAAPLYTLIYSSFMPPLYPSPIWLVSAGFYIIMILIIIKVEQQLAKFSSDRYEPLIQENE